MKSYLLAFAVLAMALTAATGCENTTATATDDGPKKTTHVHRHGPVLNGEMFDFDSDYAAEAQRVKGGNIIRIAILDGEGKKSARVPIETLTVRRASGTDDQEFTLTPSPDEETTDEGTFLFELNDEDFALAWSLGIEVEMTVGDKTYKGTLPAFEPH